MSAERDTLENPTPLTATLHRFSHMRSSSRSRLDQCRTSFEASLREAPQDDVFLNAIKGSRHPEKARSAVSKDARYSCRGSGQAELRQGDVVVQRFEDDFDPPADLRL